MWREDKASAVGTVILSLATVGFLIAGSYVCPIIRTLQEI